MRDQVVFISLIPAVLLFLFHLYQFYDSNFYWESGIRVGAFGLYPIFALVGKRKGIWIWGFIFSNILCYTIKFNNYGVILIFLLLHLFNPKLKYLLAICYTFNIVVVCTFHSKSAIHLAIHLITAFTLYFATNIAIEHLHHTKLDLTPDEIFILNKLKDGYEQKEITEFSENTVSRKLKEARVRNGLTKHKDELLLKFIEENKYTDSPLNKARSI